MVIVEPGQGSSQMFPRTHQKDCRDDGIWPLLLRWTPYQDAIYLDLEGLLAQAREAGSSWCHCWTKGAR